MEHRKRIIPILILLLVLGGGYYLYTTGRFDALGLAFATADTGIVSGFIEGEEVNIAAEVGGRIEFLAAEEGDRLTAGQEVVRLDRTLVDAQIAQAQAAVQTARAQLAQIKAGPRPEDIRQAETALDQATVSRDGAKRAWENAQVVRSNPQELDARISAAQTQVSTARFQWDTAKANAQAAETSKDAVGGTDVTNPKAKVVVDQWWAAEAAAQTAQAAYEGAIKGLQVLLDMKNNPVGANAQVDAARAAYDAASAAIPVAQARLDAAKAGATQEQVAVAEAGIKQAESALGILQVQANKLKLASPITGIVTRRAAHVGELATPNSPLLTVVQLDSVKLTIYVPETQIGTVKLGDTMNVQVDSFPGKTYTGKVVFISSQAEFTPRNIQTRAERVNTVFAVRVQIANPNGELKPGMPADASFR